MVNQEQFTSVLRTILQIGSGIAIGRGWVDADTASTIIAGVVAVAATGWGLWVRRDRGLIAAAARLPNVSEIKTDARTASAIPNDKVRAGGRIAA